MTDETTKPDEEQATPVVPPPGEDAVVDDWASAFESLEVEDPEPAPGTEKPTSEAEADPATEVSKTTESAADDTSTNTVNAEVATDDDGGSVPPTGEARDVDTDGTIGDVTATIESYEKDIEKQAIDETVEAFLTRADESGRKLIRQTDGQMGATIDDPDIYRVDKDTGTAQFFNPDTGKPFTGDNPRAQAKEWVDGYNDELRDTFNRFSETRQAELTTEMAPVLEMLKFTPKFEALDVTRRGMLEALIEDYEVIDSQGVHIGYSVDLDQALSAVNKQVTAIKAQTQTGKKAKDPTGPALDMSNSGAGQPGADKAPGSLAEALEASQNEQLAKLKK